MTILTLASSKGGCGKSTISMLLAGTLAAEGASMVVFDADARPGLSRWALHTYEGPAFEVVAEVDEKRLAHAIRAAAERVDLVLVDTAGFGNRSGAVAVASADVVIVPTQLAEADIHEAQETVGMASALAAAARRDIPSRIIVNRVTRTVLYRHALTQIDAAGLIRLDATLADRTVYGEMTHSGRVPSSGPAGAEVRALVAELRTQGWLPKVTASRLDAITA